MAAEHFSVHGVDGTRLFYETEGKVRDEGLEFLLCDGIGCDGFVWRFLREPLVEQGRIVHAHYPGHGRSELPADPERVRIADLADDMAMAMSAVGVGKAVVFGHSMGVQVALETWHRHREHVSGLVLLCGSFENPVATFKDNPRAAKILPAMRRGAELGGRRLAQTWRTLVGLPVAWNVAKATELDPDLVRREDFMPYLDHLSKMDPALFFRTLTGAAEHSAAAYLAEIDVPVLVVAGTRDGFTPAHRSEEMARRIPDCELVVVEDGTHTTPIERPVEVGMAVERLIERVRARG